MGADPTNGRRSMASYLALPRPGDLGKAIIAPLGFAVGVALTSMPSGHHLLGGLVAWFTLEYLAYQARYQWNDIRGFWSDQLHPDRDARGRLPGPVERGRAHITISATVTLGRVIMAGLLAFVLAPLHLTALVLVSSAAVFVVAAVYECVRSRAAGCRPGRRPPGTCVALWVVSGGGYCVRGLTGLIIATGTQIGALQLVVAGAACWFAGIVFVTTRWAVESLPYASPRDGRLTWSANAEARRGHLLALSHWLPHDTDAAPGELRKWRPLWAPSPWHAPWNLALLLALSSAWLTGAALSSGWLTPVDAATSAVAVLFVWAIVVLSPSVTSGVIAMIFLVGAAVLVASEPRLALPGVIVCCLYLIGTHQCLDDVGTLGRRRVRPVLASLAAERRSLARVARTAATGSVLRP